VIREFIYKYYIDPIRYGEAYTIVDTLTYAIILILAIYGVYRLLRSVGIRVDGRFVLATLPFVVLGGLARVVQDTGMITSDFQFLLVTPLIYLVLFVFTVVSLAIAILVQKQGLIRDYILLYAAFGIIGCIVTGGLLLGYGLSHRIAWEIPVIILGFALIASALVYGTMRYGLRWQYVADPLYLALIFGQLLDASATYYGIDLHPLAYVEQHVVGSSLIALTGTAFVMYPLKLIVLFPGIWILERFRNEGSPDLWHLILLAMITVGLAPGVRDMVRMTLYV
jgi:uncharacterized membrane protein